MFYSENRKNSVFPLSLLIKIVLLFLIFEKSFNYFTPLVTITVLSDLLSIRWIRYTKTRFECVVIYDILASFGAALGLGPINTGTLILPLLCNFSWINCTLRYNYWVPIGTRHYSRCFRYNNEWNWQKIPSLHGVYIFMAGHIK